MPKQNNIKKTALLSFSLAL